MRSGGIISAPARAPTRLALCLPLCRAVVRPALPAPPRLDPDRHGVLLAPHASASAPTGLALATGTPTSSPPEQAHRPQPAVATDPAPSALWLFYAVQQQQRRLATPMARKQQQQQLVAQVFRFGRQPDPAAGLLPAQASATSDRSRLPVLLLLFLETTKAELAQPVVPEARLQKRGRPDVRPRPGARRVLLAPAERPDPQRLRHAAVVPLLPLILVPVGLLLHLLGLQLQLVLVGRRRLLRLLPAGSPSHPHALRLPFLPFLLLALSPPGPLVARQRSRLQRLVDGRPKARVPRANLLRPWSRQPVGRAEGRARPRRQ